MNNYGNEVSVILSIISHTITIRVILSQWAINRSNDKHGLSKLTSKVRKM